MFSIIHLLTLRTIILSASSIFSVVFIMLMTGIIQIDDVIKIFNLSPEAGNALKVIFSRFQEVTKNLINIAAQLLNHLISWTGAEIDTSALSDMSVGNHSSSSANPPAGSEGATIGNQGEKPAMNDGIIHHNSDSQ